MKTIEQMASALLIAIAMYIVPGCSSPAHVTTGVDVQYVNPVWAPPYYPGIRYYYLPDIEVYYDLANQEFVYLDNGQWLFSHTLPSMYGGYDLYSGFVIALDIDVYQPWLHHHFYVSHYPRYYYHNVYSSNMAALRGFNENNKNPIQWRQEDRNKISDLRKMDNVEKKAMTPNRQPQAPNYYGRDIGRPVKVTHQMRRH